MNSSDLFWTVIAAVLAILIVLWSMVSAQWFEEFVYTTTLSQWLALILLFTAILGLLSTIRYGRKVYKRHHRVRRYR